MFGLGEEIKGLDLAQRVTVGVEYLKVSYLGGGITGHVDNSLRLEGKELLEEIFTASFPGRVNDNGGSVCRKGHLFKDGTNEMQEFIELYFISLPTNSPKTIVHAPQPPSEHPSLVPVFFSSVLI